MYAKQGIKAGWFLPEFMTERLKPDPKYVHLLKMAYDREYRQEYEKIHIFDTDFKALTA